MAVVERIPPPVAAASGAGSADENAWKNCWNWNLTDAAYGCLVLDVKEGRVNAEMKSQGFNYAYRRQTNANNAAATVDSGLAPPQLNHGAHSTAPGSAPNTKPGTPAPPSVKVGGTGTAASPVVSKSGTPAPDASANANATVPSNPNPNGQSAPDKDKEAAKREKKKQKEKEKRAEKAAERAANGEPGKKEKKGPNANASGGGDANTNASTNGEGSVEDATSAGLVSPDAETGPSAASGIGGAQTPTSRRGSRNPWTLFLKHLPVPVTEDEIKEFFGDAKSGVSSISATPVDGWADFELLQIVHVKIPYSNQGPNKSQRHFAYVEFGDEEAMKAGLASKGEVCRFVIYP